MQVLIPFEKCQKLHLYFDRFIPCDLKVCKNCRGKIKKDIEEHEEMLNKPIAPLYQKWTLMTQLHQFQGWTLQIWDSI